ncbi:unnamed protein product [Lepidochelys kempii]
MTDEMQPFSLPYVRKRWWRSINAFCHSRDQGVKFSQPLRAMSICTHPPQKAPVAWQKVYYTLPSKGDCSGEQAGEEDWSFNTSSSSSKTRENNFDYVPQCYEKPQETKAIHSV